MAGDVLSTKAGLHAALETTRQEVLEAFGALPPDTFFEGSAERWSPAHHLDHLTRSNRPVGQALELPRVALAAFGGTGTRESRSFESLREAYRAALASGGRASGRYVPELRTQDQAQLLQAFGAASGQVVRALARWPEDSLDRHQLPHPLLGPLTVRELLAFTLLHNAHHLQGVRARLPGTDLAAPATARYNKAVHDDT